MPTYESKNFKIIPNRRDDKEVAKLMKLYYKKADGKSVKRELNDYSISFLVALIFNIGFIAYIVIDKMELI